MYYNYPVGLPSSDLDCLSYYTQPQPSSKSDTDLKKKIKGSWLPDNEMWGLFGFFLTKIDGKFEKKSHRECDLLEWCSPFRKNCF